MCIYTCAKYILIHTHTYTHKVYSLCLTKFHSSFKWISPKLFKYLYTDSFKDIGYHFLPLSLTTFFLTPYAYISSILTFILLHLTSCLLLSIDFHFFYSSSFVSTFLQQNFFSSILLFVTLFLFHSLVPIQSSF